MNFKEFFTNIHNNIKFSFIAVQFYTIYIYENVKKIILFSWFFNKNFIKRRYFYKINLTLFNLKIVFIKSMVNSYFIFLKKFFLKKNVFEINLYRDNFRLHIFEKNVIFKFRRDINFYKNIFINSNLYGLIFFWKLIRFWILPLLSLFIIVNFSVELRVIPFSKSIFIWISVLMIFYWLLSGFVFFFKKYQFGKYTSAIQRFWKRSYILFWLLESCTLLTFFYLTLIANQESYYMFDQAQIVKTHLFSWRIFLFKLMPVVLLILLTYFLMLSLKWNLYSKHTPWLIVITLLLTYTIWLEFYQFYHLINFYGNFNWVYDSDERIWNLELEPRKTRTVNHYVIWLLILKFWHLLFVYIFWIFFILRSWEIKKIRYPLLAANFQNLIILYLMSWLCMYPWLKLYFRKFMEISYSSFFLNNRTIIYRIFFNDISVFWKAIKLYSNDCFLVFTKYFFYYLHNNSYVWLYNQTRKHFVKDQLLQFVLSCTFN